MSKILNISVLFININSITSKSLHLFILFQILQLFQITSCQNFTTITSESLQYDGVFGLGWGVISIIIALITGILCCILGTATINPSAFVTIGFCLPITMFIFMVTVPLNQPGNINLKDNPAKNNYIVVRWFYFSLMLLGLILIFIPFYLFWSNMLIPQRVDSRAQREYYEKYEKLLSQEKLKIEREKENRKSRNFSVANPTYPNKDEILLPVRNNNNLELQNLDPINENNNINDNNFQNDRKNKVLKGLRRRKDPNIDENIEDRNVN